MKSRDAGPDLIRLLAFLFVVIFHSFLNNGYYGQSQMGLPMVLAGSVRWLSVSCIGLFLMLTGYLKCSQDARGCLRSLPPVLLGYGLAAAVSIPVRHFLLGDTQTLAVWVQRLFSFRAVYYGWYVEMYVGLALLMPFVNLLLNRLNAPKSLLLLAGSLLCLTALPGATPLSIAPAYWRAMYPLTYYVLGAAVRRLKPEVPPLAGIGGALGIALALGTVTVLSTDGTINKAFTQEFGDLWITCMVVCLFVGLYRIQPGERVRKVLAFGAGGCYGGYLLSHLLDSWCYRLFPQWHTPQNDWKLFVCVTLPIFVISLLAGRLLQEITARLLPRRKEAAV